MWSECNITKVLGLNGALSEFDDLAVWNLLEPFSEAAAFKCDLRVQVL